MNIERNNTSPQDLVKYRVSLRYVVVRIDASSGFSCKIKAY